MKTMPPKPRPAAMSPAKLRAIIKASGMSQTKAAKALGVARQTVTRWLSNHTPISRANARLINEVLKPKN